MLPIHENLAGKTAVITGGSGVLCSEMAKELARQNVNVVILNRKVESGHALAEEIINNGGSALSVAGDVLDRKSLEVARDLVIDKFGRIDILINGAGGNHPDSITDTEIYDKNKIGKSFFDLDERGFERVFSTNLTGSFLASQIFGAELLKQSSSTIINISSMSSYTPLTKVPAYSAAKSGINNFTMWLAVHFANTGMRVNAIAPGFFLTNQNKDLLTNTDGSYTERSNKILSHTPMEKFGKPEDLIGTLLWLVDEEYSGFITGITVPVDGGFMAYSGV